MSDWEKKMSEDLILCLDSLAAACCPEEGSLLVIGGSSSEILGEHIGHFSSQTVGDQVIETSLNWAKEHKIQLAVQCCEHLNRALVIEKSAAIDRCYPRVHAIPQTKAGGSFATAAWHQFNNPCLVEAIQADLGIDIGDSFIGMHMKPVAVPWRMPVATIGKAHVTACYSRLKLIGGKRAVYSEEEVLAGISAES